MFRKAQISVEYMLIMGFVAIMTIPLIVIYYTYTTGSTDEIITSQVTQLAHKIVDSAESVYFLGEPSQTTIKVYIPKQITGASIDNKEVLFNVSTQSGNAEIVQVSSIILNGSLPIKQGAYFITVKALNTSVNRYVNISYK